MRNLIIAAFCLAIFVQIPALAWAQQDLFDAQAEEEEDGKPSGGMRTVTPINKCLDQLPEADAMEIKGNYLKPYQECQRRLQTIKRGETDDKKTDSKKARSKKTAKDDTDDNEDGEETASGKEPAPAEDARNFIRVRKDDSPRRPANYGDTAKTAPAEAAKSTSGQGSRVQLYNR